MTLSKAILFDDRRRHRAADAQPARPAQQLHRRDARRSARRARQGEGRRLGARAAADRRRPRLLRGAGPRAIAPSRRAASAVDLGASIERNYQPLVLALRVAAAAGGLRGQRRRRRRRRQPRARLRHRHRRAVGELHPGVLQARPDPGLRRHVFPAAARRHRAGDGPRDARRQAVGGAGGGVGSHLEVRRRRRACRRSSTRLLAQLATAPTRGLARTKRALYASPANTLEAQLDLERDLQRELGYSDDYREGVAAFLAKRPPTLQRPVAQIACHDRRAAADRHRRRRSAPARWAPASRRSPRRRPSRPAVRHALRRGRRGQGRRSPTTLGKLVAKGKLAAADAEAALQRIATVVTLPDACVASLVVEAIVEDLDAKRELFARLENVVAPECILASNTSSLSITALADGLEASGARRRHALLQSGAADAAGRGRSAGSRPIRGVARHDLRHRAAWGKTPVHAASTPGFIVNRCARPFYGEALRLLAERAAEPATIDAVMREAGGFRMGPFELMDLIGHDVNFAVTQSVWEAFFHDPRFTPSALQQELVAAGFSAASRARLLRLRRRRAPCRRRRPSDRGRGPRASSSTANRASPRRWSRGSRPRVSPSISAAADAALRRMRAARASPDGDVWLVAIGRPHGDRERDAAGVRDLVVFDLALDYANATRLAVARADGCSDAAGAAAAGALQAAGIAVSRIDDCRGARRAAHRRHARQRGGRCA